MLTSRNVHRREGRDTSKERKIRITWLWSWLGAQLFRASPDMQRLWVRSLVRAHTRINQDTYMKKWNNKLVFLSPSLSLFLSFSKINLKNKWIKCWEKNLLWPNYFKPFPGSPVWTPSCVPTSVHPRVLTPRSRSLRLVQAGLSMSSSWEWR